MQQPTLSGSYALPINSQAFVVGNSIRLISKTSTNEVVVSERDKGSAGWKELGRMYDIAVNGKIAHSRFHDRWYSFCEEQLVCIDYSAGRQPSQLWSYPVPGGIHDFEFDETQAHVVLRRPIQIVLESETGAKCVSLNPHPFQLRLGCVWGSRLVRFDVESRRVEVIELCTQRKVLAYELSKSDFDSIAGSALAGDRLFLFRNDADGQLISDEISLSTCTKRGTVVLGNPGGFLVRIVDSGLSTFTCVVGDPIKEYQFGAYLTEARDSLNTRHLLHSRGEFLGVFRSDSRLVVVYVDSKAVILRECGAR